jgi:GntR family transcriptional regulator / MocR family aminotransferase
MTGLATDLLVRLDPQASEGLQQQIYNGVRKAILEGIVRPGARIPSSRALAADLGVSRTTTLLAFEQLMAEGYLATRHGSGTFVSHELPDGLPAGRDSRPTRTTKHPPLSRRIVALAEVPASARRVAGPPRPFRLGVPALDLFPVQIWSRLASSRTRSVTSVQLDYGPSMGLLALREAIVDYVCASRGTKCTVDQIHVVAGSQSGLSLMCNLLLDPGDRAWMEDPGYPGARSALVAAGARISPIPVDADGLDVEAGARRAGGARLAYVTPSHQFPLGMPMSLPRRLALLRWASAAGAWVVEDDYDSEFRHGERPLPCLHGLDVDGRVVYVGSFSKTLFPSLRIGFLIAPSDLHDRLREARPAGDVVPPMIEQAVLADFMGKGHFERHLRRMRVAYQERREALVAQAERLCSGVLRIRAPRTGLHVVGDLDGVRDSRVFEEAAARGVEVMPLSAFYSGGSKATNGLVLGFGGVRSDAVRGGMEALAAAIEAARRPSASIRRP